MKNFRPGILSNDQLQMLVDEKKIENTASEKLVKIDASSFDLHISDTGFHMRGSVKPLADEDINKIISTFKYDSMREETGKFLLKKNETYIFQIQESLNLTDTTICGQATGKSTFGRLDILTRLLCNKATSFDTVDENYSGTLWIEVTPLTFPVIIQKGTSLNQLRLFKGPQSNCRIESQNLGLYGELFLGEDGRTHKNNQENLTLNLNEDPTKPIRNFRGFKANKISDDDFLDLTKNFDLDDNKYDPKKYWEPVGIEDENELILKLENERFYILRSRERFKLPNTVGIYCQAVTEQLGELRIHYAGFVHPFFGTNRKDEKGAPLIFEIRGHSVNTILRHRETLAKLEYYSMSDDATLNDDSYRNQELTLSKCFNEWEA